MTKNRIQSDILEWSLPEEVLSVLLKDRTTGENLIWATEDYAQRGAGFGVDDQITVAQITSKNDPVIRPRVNKNADEQRQHFGTYCKIMNWETGQPIEFRSIVEKGGGHG